MNELKEVLSYEVQIPLLIALIRGVMALSCVLAVAGIWSLTRTTPDPERWLLRGAVLLQLAAQALNAMLRQESHQPVYGLLFNLTLILLYLNISVVAGMRRWCP